MTWVFLKPSTPHVAPSTVLTLHSDVQLQLFRLHRLLISLYPPALLPTEYPTRLIRICLGRLSPLLDSRPLPGGPGGSALNGAGSVGKRGKKRARGAEDGLVASLEGRSGRTIGSEGEVIVEALQRESQNRGAEQRNRFKADLYT